VSKVIPERGKLGGTDITVTAMSRNPRARSVSQGLRGGAGNRKLPPLVLPGSLGSQGESIVSSILIFVQVSFNDFSQAEYIPIY
jgi:hypothetical protein